jgi:bifunctional DNA-binding transcriptional regulator/antitoxin component of YhaV-PrlF toxin-antitoxin module
MIREQVGRNPATRLALSPNPRTMLNTTLVVVQKKGCVTIPWHLRTDAGIEIGDMLDVSLKNGKIIFSLHKKSSAKSWPVSSTKPKAKKK